MIKKDLKLEVLLMLGDFVTFVTQQSLVVLIRLLSVPFGPCSFGSSLIWFLWLEHIIIVRLLIDTSDNFRQRNLNLNMKLLYTYV